jgi:hypothetical protein
MSKIIIIINRQIKLLKEEMLEKEMLPGKRKVQLTSAYLG